MFCMVALRAYTATMSEQWWEYVERVTAPESAYAIAKRLGLTPSAISRWKSGDVPRAENVIAFARAYNQSPQDALVAAGYLEAGEAGKTVTIESHSMDVVSDAELAEEMSRRLAYYSDIVGEMRRRVEADDPRRIEPGSAGDVFPQWSDGPDRRRSSR